MIVLHASAVQDMFEGYATGRFETLTEIQRFIAQHRSFPLLRDGASICSAFATC